MDKNGAGKYLKRYYACALSAALLVGACLCFLVFWVRQPWIALAFCAAFFATKKYFIMGICNLIFLPILFQKLDPYEFQEAVFADKRFFPPISYRIYAAIYLGDYQTAINICNSRLKSKISIKNKCSYLQMLAFVYFTLCDCDKLRMICDKFYECVPVFGSARLKKTYEMMEIFRRFSIGEYEECREMCKQNAKKKRNKKTSLAYVNGLFIQAIVHYKLGEHEQATQFFKDIIVRAPKMHVAILSQKHLDAIENKSVVEFPNLLPEARYVIPGYAETLNKAKQNQILYLIGFALVALALWLEHW